MYVLEQKHREVSWKVPMGTLWAKDFGRAIEELRLEFLPRSLCPVHTGHDFAYLISAM